MSIIQFLRILWARRLLIAAAVVSCVVGAFLVTRVLPPRYEAHSRVLLELVKPDPVTGVAMSSQFARVYTRTQVELIKDYQVAGAVVEQLGWLESPELVAEYRSRARGDLDIRRWAAQRVIQGTEARLIEGSNILEITYTSSTPESARLVADALRQAYIDTSLATRRAAAARTATWFEAQTAKVKAALDAAEMAKSAYERENGIILTESKIDVDSARLAALASAASAPMIAPVAAGVTPSSAQLAQLDAAIAQASQSLGPNHPELVEMKNRRVQLARVAAQERSAANAAAGAAASAARIGAGMLEAQKSKVIGQRDKLERLRQLQTEVDVRRDQFIKSQARAAELRQEAEIGEVGLSPLGSAVTPPKPTFPNMPLVMFGALGFGLGFGVLVALLTELFGRRIRGVEDLSSAIEAPLLAVIAAPAKPRRVHRLSGPSRRSGKPPRQRLAQA